MGEKGPGIEKFLAWASQKKGEKKLEKWKWNPVKHKFSKKIFTPTKNE